MNNLWIAYVLVGLFFLWRIIALFKNNDAKWWFSDPSRNSWNVIGQLSALALVVGAVLISISRDGDDPGNFLLAFYPVRFWCVLIAALVGVIFWLGSALERRVAGVAAVLVFAGLEVHSVVRENPSYGPILKGYAALCIVLCFIAIARRFRQHRGPAVPAI